MRGCRLGSTYVELAPEIATWVPITQWLGRLIGYQNIADLVPGCDSGIVFSEVRVDERLSII